MKWEASESSFSTRDPVPGGSGGWQPRRRAVSPRWQRSAPSLGRSRVFVHQRVCVFCLVAPSRPGRALRQPLRPGKAAARFCVGQEAAGGSVLLPRCSPPQLGAAGCGCTALSSQAVRWDPEKLSPVGAFVQKFEGEQDSSSLVGFLLKGLAEFSKPRSEVRLVHGW